MTAGRQKILIVDDTLANIEILNGILRGEYQIFFAKSGEAAFRVVEREAPDLILLDIMMPDLDGYEVCDRLKSDPKTSAIPIIFVTAMSSPEDEAKGLARGAVDYITKPISPPIVKARVRNHLELKRSRDLLQELNRELERKNEELQKLAVEDALTGLANRRQFDEVLAKEARRACRTHQFLSIIMCDVDFFKRYNDSYGHPEGDDCLRAVAATLRASARRAADLVARYGGEEFAVILPDTPPEEAARLAERMRAAMAALAVPHRASAVAQVVTLSLGVAGARMASEGDGAALVKGADAALYRAKEGGRNRVVSAPEPPESR